jgi:CSLREA domain-containing protein
MPRRPSRRIASPRLRNRLRCEVLEDRRVLATYVVSSTANAGEGSLREAIDLANGTVGVADEIVFDETLFATPQAILLDSQLPTITDALSIVGPGAELLTLDGQNGNNRVPFTGDGWQAVQVTDSSASTRIEVAISGLTFTNFDRSVALSNAESLTLDSVAFMNTHGRAVSNTGALVVREAFFQNNRGGAIFNDGDLQVFDSKFLGNRAALGGAIYNSKVATITDSLFEANISTANGGAISSPDTNDQITITSSTFTANVAASAGGAAYLGNGLDASIVVNSTFSGNKANTGAAIAVERGFTMRHSTVVDNRVMSSSRAGIDALYTQTSIRIDHSIVAGTVYQFSNSLSPAADLRGYEPPVVTNSVIGYDNQYLVDGENGNHVGSLLTPIDPHLAPLAYNGGPTPTHAPMPGSILINAGAADFVPASGATDQRGGPYQRVVGRIDIGAVEAQGAVVAAAGDFNGDGRFDAADYTVWRDSLGTSVAPLTAGDATGDGVVDETDRQLWVSRYGDRYVPRVVVNSLADDDDGDIYNGRTTLREAINYTNVTLWADSITFDPSLSGGVINVATAPYPHLGYYQIEGGLTIDASMVPEGITLDAGGRTTGLHINAYHVNTDNNFDVTLIGLTIRNGVGQFGGGGAVNSLMNGVLTLIDCELHDNISGSNGGYGGAIYAEGSVKLFDTIIDGATSSTTNSFAGGSGSAIFAVGDVTLLRSHLLNVSATAGGGAIAAVAIRTGLSLLRLDFAPSVVLVDSSITNAAGGGIVAPGTVSLTRSTVEGVSGIGIVASGNPGLHPVVGNVELVDSVVRGFSIVETGGTYNYFGTAGGAGIAAMGSVSLVRSRVEDNTVTNPLSTRGGGIYARGTVSLLDSVVDGNSAAYGAGIYAEGRTVGGANLPAGTTIVSVVGSSVSGNAALRNGAAITSKGALIVETSSISGNAITAYWSDGLWQAIVSIDNTASPSLPPVVTFTDVVLANNAGPPSPIEGLLSPSYVLAGYGFNPVNATLVRTHVIDNQMNGVLATTIIDSVISRNAGFGASVGKEVRGSTISGNRDGGVMGGNLLIADSVIRGNSTSISNFQYSVIYRAGGQPAAGVISSGVVVLARSLVADNQMTLLTSLGTNPVAGGVMARELVAIDSTIRDNTIMAVGIPGVTGGGVAVFGTGDAKFYRSTVSGNRTMGEGARGGGVYSADVVELVQSTVSGNSAEGVGAAGGGVYTKTLSTTHSTIADNAAESLGGGVYVTGPVSMEGTIVAGNAAPDGGPDFYRMGTGALTVNYSLLGDASDSGVDETTGAGNLLGVDPLLGPLGDNGGPTWTHALLPGSPAIDAGDPTRVTVPWTVPASGAFPGASFTGDVDQRGAGFPRLVDGGTGVLRIDMGAVEAGAPIAPAYVWTPPMISIEPTTTNEPSLSLPESYDIAFAELSAWRASLLIELSDLNTLDSNDAASFELLEDLVAADCSQETIDDAVRAEFSSWAR